jgi:N-acetylglucosaminyldiphosphoundecaprenol N-acetyl-beta-D-mannosaminyltransferase
MSHSRVEILGCPADNLSMEQALDEIDGCIRSRVPHQHVAINVRKVVGSYLNAELRGVVRQCDLALADGQPIVWASRMLGRPLKGRVTGIDLMQRLLERAADRGYKVFLLGARREVLEKVVLHYQHKYPALQVVGYRHGYWAADQEAQVVEAIREAKPDVLFVAMGSPKKEVFVSEYRDRMRVPFAMGVGGSFDVIAGNVRRAPSCVQRAGFEWLWRVLHEPVRLGRRYVVDGFIFGFLLAREYFRYRVGLVN